MPTKPIDYLVHHYFAVKDTQYRGVSRRVAENASLYESLIEVQREGMWYANVESSLEHPTKWSSEDRAHLLTLNAFNKQFIGIDEEVK